jgi:GalNAc-alpha-(1->4)-GalNAc-alpha-(1->3)-diNAcBac-PP-undecaprenol alpha-1,4-N-acetyl-D-galactosaminyltransferase
MAVGTLAVVSSTRLSSASVYRLSNIYFQVLMKVTLVIYALGAGGAERVMSIMANYWAARGWTVTLITLVDRHQPPFYQLDPQIHLQQLNVAGESTNLLGSLQAGWQRIKALRSAIIASKPDVIISFMNTVNVLVLLAGWKLNIPTIVSEHIYPGFTDANKIWQLLMKWTYRYADRVTLLTQNALPFYPASQGYRSIVMPNPVLTPAPDLTTGSLVPRPTVMAMGRLHPQKGFDLLLPAFAQIQSKYPDWHLTILGEGPMRAELEALRTRLGLVDRVHFLGSVKNVDAHLRQADLFVMPSRFEGFPMALCEAMACGLPILAADCLSGPRDIIREGIDGILVPIEDIDALAAGLDRLMGDPIQRQQLAQAAPQVLERFGLERVMGMWMDTIKQTIERRAR